jgi:hypothetical protein
MARLLWTQRQDFGPAPRFGHAMVFDAARGNVVMMGGRSSNGTPLGDTWTWDGDGWTQVADMGPSPRSNFGIAYDSSRERVVIFGGASDKTIFGDTWEWDGDAWTQTSDSGPSARSGAAMTFASADSNVLLVGGLSSAGDLLGDTWTWDGTEWSQAESTGLSPRRDHVMAYDSVRQRATVFGGRDVNGSRTDTWEWDGSLWTQRADFGPPASFGGSMVFTGSRCPLYGGVSGITTADNPPEVFQTTWEWDGRYWTERQDFGPGPRVSHAMACDLARRRVVLFGGTTTPLDAADTALSATSSTWEHIVAAELTPTPGPIPLASVAVSPNTISSAAGDTVRVTVTLTAPAPSAGNLVILSYVSDAGALANLRFYGGFVVRDTASGEVMMQPIPPNSLPPQRIAIQALSGGVTRTTYLEIAA